MRRPLLSFCLTIAFGAAGLFETKAGPSPTVAATASFSPAPSSDPVDQIAESDLTKALDYIRKNYVKPAALSEPQLNRATLSGLLDRLGRGIILQHARPTGENSPTPFFHDLLAGHIGYLRPGAMRKNDLAELDDTLRNFAAKNVDALILDLRAVADSDDFTSAAEFAKRFVPRGQPLFVLRGAQPNDTQTFSSDRSPGYVGFIALLIDEDTAGAAEAVADTLHARSKAILLGAKTAGAAFAYETLALPNDLNLRVATAQAVLPEQPAGGTQNLSPDLPVALSRANKQEIFQVSLTKGIAPYVFENDRPHLNEAALLAGTNPEIEAAQSAQQRRARGDKMPLHDPVVQRAVDVITSISVYEKQPSPAHSP